MSEWSHPGRTDPGGPVARGISPVDPGARSRRYSLRPGNPLGVSTGVPVPASQRTGFPQALQRAEAVKSEDTQPTAWTDGASHAICLHLMTLIQSHQMQIRVIRCNHGACGLWSECGMPTCPALVVIWVGPRRRRVTHWELVAAAVHLESAVLHYLPFQAQPSIIWVGHTVVEVTRVRKSHRVPLIRLWPFGSDYVLLHPLEWTPPPEFLQVLLTEYALWAVPTHTVTTPFRHRYVTPFPANVRQ
jgi:hypothetical protein